MAGGGKGVDGLTKATQDSIPPFDLHAESTTN